MVSPPPVPLLMARSMLSLGMLAARHLSSTMRRRGFMPGSPPAILAAMVISLLSLAKILPRLASIAPLKCLTLAHLLCPDIVIVLDVLVDPARMAGFHLHRRAVTQDLGDARARFPWRRSGRR